MYRVCRFKVEQKNIDRVIELSGLIFAEMNSATTVISSHQVLRKTDDEESLCWHLTWISLEAAKAATARWPTFASTQELHSLVDDSIYYGHFVVAT